MEVCVRLRSYERMDGVLKQSGGNFERLNNDGLLAFFSREYLTTESHRCGVHSTAIKTEIQKTSWSSTYDGENVI